MRAETILIRLDKVAYQQMAAELLRLAAENERLQRELDRAEAHAARNFAAWQEAEESAEHWREDAFKFQTALCERDGGQPAIDPAGRLHIAPVQGEA